MLNKKTESNNSARTPFTCMGSLVQCPKCSWRGFRYYFPNHYDKAHPKDIYTEAMRVDEGSLDSRPRIHVIQ